ncbi:transcriptional regulator with XRE-family HTH domain [Desulfitispora alkaliphila]|uniref:helix-turn-helix domain-containing protein n=1 Tax=Desulfitispora alkaliphila TaxID=622674 RepID=UPI003D1F823A
MLSERLIVARKNKDMTQEAVAAKLGITRPAYTAYEKGRRQPDYDILNQLADIFEVSTDYLLGRTDNPKGYTDDELSETDIEKLIKDGKIQYRGEPVDEEDRESLKEFIKLAFRTIKNKKK